MNLGVGEFIEPEKDIAVWNQAFEKTARRSLISYPGALGKLIGDSFHREGFIAFMGVEKAGKSYSLMDATYRALRQRLKVAYFEAGDLGQDEVIARIGQRCCRLPLRPGEYTIPEGDSKASNFDADVVFKKIRYDSQVNANSSYKAFLKVTRGRSLLRLCSYPNSTLTVSEIDGLLEQWSAEDWVPDVVVIDYADILAPPPGFLDVKEQIDEVWNHLRRLSQKWHCLVLTATQASANSYDQTQPLSRKNFSGRKTKLAHVSGMIGLNTTKRPSGDDQPLPIVWNWIVRRDAQFSEGNGVEVYGSIDVGCPIIRTKKVSTKKREDNSENSE